jgi:hypothetical protein
MQKSTRLKSALVDHSRPTTGYSFAITNGGVPDYHVIRNLAIGDLRAQLFYGFGQRIL